MAKLNIDVPSKWTAQDTFSKIKQLFDETSDLKKFDPQMACTFNDNKMCGSAKGSKFSAELQVNGAATGSAVSIVIELPFLLSPLKGQIKSTVEKKINALLG